MVKLILNESHDTWEVQRVLMCLRTIVDAYALLRIPRYLILFLKYSSYRLDAARSCTIILSPRVNTITF